MREIMVYWVLVLKFFMKIYSGLRRRVPLLVTMRKIVGFKCTLTCE
jgi:hypothetical protein